MKVPEKYRVLSGEMATTEADGHNGLFLVPFESFTLCVVAGDGFGWDHVSVSAMARVPLWAEMCWVKSLFFEDDECVVEFHQATKDYMNDNPNVLHLWRCPAIEFTMPQKICV